MYCFMLLKLKVNMLNNFKLLVLSFFCFSLIDDNIHAIPHSYALTEENKLANQKVDVNDYPTLETYEETVLWFGCGCPNKKVDFNPRGFNNNEKEKYIENGLSYLKQDKKDRLHSEVLTGYYLDKKDLPKALYWANIGAENGSGYCMSQLRHAYGAGEGVVIDLIESSKWAHLASAKGVEEETVLLRKFEELANQNVTVRNIIKEGRERALLWEKKHPQAFFDPN